MGLELVEEIEQGESNMHRSWSPCCVAFAPLFPKGNWPFSGTRNSFSVGSPALFYRISCMNPLVFPLGDGGQRWCEMVALKSVHV